MIRLAVLIQCTRVTDRRTELAWHIRAIAYMLSRVKHYSHSTTLDLSKASRQCTGWEPNLQSLNIKFDTLNTVLLSCPSCVECFLFVGDCCCAVHCQMLVLLLSLCSESGGTVCIPLHCRGHHPEIGRLELLRSSVGVSTYGRSQRQLGPITHQQRLRGLSSCCYCPYTLHIQCFDAAVKILSVFLQLD